MSKTKKPRHRAVRHTRATRIKALEVKLERLGRGYNALLALLVKKEILTPDDIGLEPPVAEEKPEPKALWRRLFGG